MNIKFPLVVILVLLSLGAIGRAGPAAEDPRVTPLGDDTLGDDALEERGLEALSERLCG